jgi:hypothetical protein
MYAIKPVERRIRALPLKLAFSVVAGAALLLAGAVPAQTQATRTWVSGTGDDAFPCSRTAPCKTFPGAINNTAAGGEINVLDPGSYGAVTIGKSITIDGTGNFAGILASGGINGIVINANPVPANPVVVRLRGLNINGAGTTRGLNGIRVLIPAVVFVEDVLIDGFSTHGIDFQPSGASELYVTNTTIRNVGSSGIFASLASGLGTVSVDDSRFENNAFGINIANNTRATVNNSVAVNNTSAGLFAQTTVNTATPAVLNVERTISSMNGTGLQVAGVSGQSSPTTARITNVMIANNTIGISTTAPADVISFGNNRIAGNTTNGAPTSTVPQQ